jgi:hypothetical protein
MQQKIEHAKRQAHEARESARRCSDKRVQDEWIRVASLWDELAEEYRRFQTATGNADLPRRR